LLIPVFVVRIFRRWTLAHCRSTASPRPASLATYFAMMTITGIGFTTLKLYPWDEIAADLEDGAAYIILFAGPMIAIAFIHAYLLSGILGTQQGGRSWRNIWLLLSAITAVTVVASMCGFALYVLHDTSDDWDFEWPEYALISLLLIVTITVAAGFSVCSYLWLRWLGYELRATSTSIQS
jgi:hypothetical protein